MIERMQPSGQRERAIRFGDLHVKGDPLILYNIWDAGSAKAVEEAGAKAIATGSWSVAAAHGYEDEEMIPLDLVIANAVRIVRSVKVPVTIDFESGYGTSASQVHENVARLIETGAVGINFEDQIIGSEGMYAVRDQCDRIRAARRAAEDASIPLFINARSDLFLKSEPSRHNALMVEAEQRAGAYADAGASGFFAPGLRDAQGIERLCKSVTLPVNIMFLPDAPTLSQMADLGVARISYGPRPYRQMMLALKEAATKVMSPLLQ